MTEAWYHETCGTAPCSCESPTQTTERLTRERDEARAEVALLRDALRRLFTEAVTQLAAIDPDILAELRALAAQTEDDDGE